MYFRKNESSLLDLDPVPVSLKQPPIEAQPEFDQILDLSNDATSSGPPLATPLIAFEDSITTSPKQEVPTSGIIMKYQTCPHLVPISFWS